MKKKIAIALAGVMIASSLGGCGLVDKIPFLQNNESSESVSSQNSSSGPEEIELLGDLMGETMPDSEDDGAGEAQAPAMTFEESSPENQTVVTKADDWQGYYGGTVRIIGFGDDYTGIEQTYSAYAFVAFPADDHPFLDIYSNDFNVWTNYSFSASDENGQALASMYVEPTDTELIPVVYKFGDAYVIDVNMTDAEAQAFKATSDGVNPARIVASYNYQDPEAAEAGRSTGFLMLFDLTKERIDD